MTDFASLLNRHPRTRVAPISHSVIDNYKDIAEQEGVRLNPSRAVLLGSDEKVEVVNITGTSENIHNFQKKSGLRCSPVNYNK